MNKGLLYIDNNIINKEIVSVIFSFFDHSSMPLCIDLLKEFYGDSSYLDDYIIKDIIKLNTNTNDELIRTISFNKHEFEHNSEPLHILKYEPEKIIKIRSHIIVVTHTGITIIRRILQKIEKRFSIITKTM